MYVSILKSLEELAYICETTHNNMKYNTTCKTIKSFTLKGYEKQLRVKDKVNWEYCYRLSSEKLKLFTMKYGIIEKGR